MKRWAKSWQTPRPSSKASPTGVRAVVTFFSYLSRARTESISRPIPSYRLPEGRGRPATKASSFGPLFTRRLWERYSIASMRDRHGLRPVEPVQALARRPAVRPHDRRGPDRQFLVGDDQVEQIDAVAHAVAVRGDGRIGGDFQPIAEVRLVLVRGRRHAHFQHRLRHGAE